MKCEHCEKDFDYPYLDYAGPGVAGGIPVCPHCKKAVQWPPLAVSTPSTIIVHPTTIGGIQRLLIHRGE